MNSGPDRLAAESLRAMVSESATFQAELLVTTATEAQDRIFLRRVDPATERRPYAMITIDRPTSWSLDSGGAQNFLIGSGSLILILQRDTDENLYDDGLAAEYAALDFFGNVIKELADMSGSDGNLAIRRVTAIEFAETPEEDREALGRFFWLACQVEWGDGST